MIYKTHEQAYKHAQKLRAQHNDDGIMVRVEHSPYGGFRVRLVPIDLMVDRLIDNPQNISNNRSTAFC